MPGGGAVLNLPPGQALPGPAREPRRCRDRALDFLREQELVHRIESRNAFIACVHGHEAHEPVVFLICEKCGAVGEAASAAVADTIKNASRAAGFVPKTPVIEISGICAHCKAA